MPRQNNYYETALKQTAPVAPATSTQPILPTSPQPDLINKMQDYGQKVEQEKQNMGISQQQLDNNIRKAVDRASYSSALTEANRPLISSLPYEFANVLFDMPDQGYWETSMTNWEKIKHIGGEVPKTLWNIIKAAPKEIVKAPLRLQHGLFDLETRLLDKISGYEPGTNPQLDAFRTKREGYTLPVLGDVKGVGASYDEGIAMGLSPFASTVKATGEFAGDLAMTASLTEAVGSAFKPRVVTVQKPVTGTDFRPLQAEQIQSIKASAKAGENKIVTSEPIQFGEAVQNPNVSYFKLTKNAAGKYNGNPNNTFLKITPAGEGTAQISVVQVRKSLFDQAKDALSAKFGKSNVVQGQFGPELKLDSGVIKYNPTSLTRIPESASLAETATAGVSKSPSLENILGSLGKRAAAVSTAEAYQFYSPNVEENLNFEDALSRTKSGNQILYRKIGEDIDKQLGYQSQAMDAIGDWSDGAENTVFNMIQKVQDFDELRYSTALKGKIGKQKAVIPFMVNNAGADSLFITDIKGVDIAELRPKLDELGINFRTLVSGKDGVKVVVFDPGSQLTANIEKLGQLYNSEITVRKGQGEFLGSDATREAGAAEYEKIIKEYESRIDRKIYDPKVSMESGYKVNNSRLIDPYTKARMARKNPDLLGKSELAQPSVMAKPLKGSENSLVEAKQADQILGISAERELSDVTIQAIVKTVTGKDNLYELNQAEAYDVSETVRNFADSNNVPESDASIILRSYTHPARYWMESAERELKYPAYSQVFLPMETATRVLKVYSDRWQQKAREVFDKYSDPRFAEERRLINSYIEGNKKSVTENSTLSTEVKMDLARIGDWLIDTYKNLFQEIGIKSTRYFGEYAPKIRKVGGIKNLYKSSEMPTEIKPFFEFEREGSLSPMEDDALVLFDIYTRAIGKKKFLAEPVKNATMVMGRMPENLKKAVNDYVQEKLGYQDKVSEYFNSLSQKLSKNTNGVLPDDTIKQVIDYGMTTSYAGALGLPRIMPILRNAIQPLLTTYPDVGPRWFTEGVKRYMKPGALQELKDKGFLVEMGVPYGAELANESGKSYAGRILNYYKEFNKKTMKPYAGIDNMSRGVTYYSVKARFEDAWNKFIEKKIDYNQFERDIDMAGFNPTLRGVLRTKFAENKPQALEEAQDLMMQDILDRTQFPYRKGSESRLHYGLGGKLGLQFAQWSWEYAFTLKSWMARGQWDKVVRWLGVSAAIKRSVEENTNIDVTDWAAFGPFTGFPLGPIGKAASSAISGINAAFTGMDDEVNKNWKDIANSLKIYGGVLTGVGTQKIKNFWESIKRYEAGVVTSTDPDPEKKFGIWSTNGKLIRWVSFSELLNTLLGFRSKSGVEQSDRISTVKKDQIEYQAQLDKAMNYLIDGNFDKFDKSVIDNNLLIPDISAKIKSYNIPLDQRIFERLPLQLKEKYFNAFFPTQE